MVIGQLTLYPEIFENYLIIEKREETNFYCQYVICIKMHKLMTKRPICTPYVAGKSESPWLVPLDISKAGRCETIVDESCCRRYGI